MKKDPITFPSDKLRRRIRWLAGRLNGLDAKKDPLLKEYYRLTEEADKRRAEGKYN